MKTPIYIPTKLQVQHSNIEKYRLWLEANKGVKIPDYDALQKWSVAHLSDFWESCLQYFNIAYSGSYNKVFSADEMPNVKWFEGIKLSYAEHIFRNYNDEKPAIIFSNECGKSLKISWKALENNTAKIARYLSKNGIKQGDRVVGYLPNIPEATIAFLATNSLGGVWSSISPDFSAEAVVARWSQIAPKILFIADGYTYKSKKYNTVLRIVDILKGLPTLQKIIVIPYVNDDIPPQKNTIHWQKILLDTPDNLSLKIKRVDFSAPLWVLYSSGTTGKPKAITHSVGGCLIEHLKYLTFHNDVKKGERFFWATTTGWMMWNFLHGALLCGATIMLYEGGVFYPKKDVLWEFATRQKINHFGTSATFLEQCRKAKLTPIKLPHLKSISATGAPLKAMDFEWVYEHITPKVPLWSMSGGTDVCTAFAGGMPTKNIYSGEITAVALGVSLRSFDKRGSAIFERFGEMVIDRPMPSMPLFFWNDPDKKNYKSTYFSMYKNIWQHGDWVKCFKNGALMIGGRSDSTLNKNGVRIGTAEFYNALENMNGILDSLVVHLSFSRGDKIVLFVKTEKLLTKNLRDDINAILQRSLSVYHKPDEILQVPDIPYTLSGKKVEIPVKKILMGVPQEKAIKKYTLRNPEALDFFTALASSYFYNV